MRRAGAAIPSLCASAVLIACGAQSAHGATRTVVFPFELIDATQTAGAFGYDAPGGLPQGPSKAETERLARISADLRERVAKDARFMLVPEADVAAEVAAKQPISQCNGCEDDIAKSAGARLALVATVEKLSDLLFNFKLYLRDVREQKLTAVLSTTVQGSTDEAWARGVRHLAERQLHAAGVPE
jgi:hypothetical protein